MNGDEGVREYVYAEQCDEGTHFYQIERTGENSETGSWIAVCSRCGHTDSPDILNWYMERNYDWMADTEHWRDEYKRQRDELLAACEALIEVLATSDMNALMAVRRKAQAAIASVKGQADE